MGRQRGLQVAQGVTDPTLSRCPAGTQFDRAEPSSTAAAGEGRKSFSACRCTSSPCSTCRTWSASRSASARLRAVSSSRAAAGPASHGRATVGLAAPDPVRRADAPGEDSRSAGPGDEHGVTDLPEEPARFTSSASAGSRGDRGQAGAGRVASSRCATPASSPRPLSDQELLEAHQGLDHIVADQARRRGPRRHASALLTTRAQAPVRLVQKKRVRHGHPFISVLSTVARGRDRPSHWQHRTNGQDRDARPVVAVCFDLYTTCGSHHAATCPRQLGLAYPLPRDHRAVEPVRGPCACAESRTSCARPRTLAPLLRRIERTGWSYISTQTDGTLRRGGSAAGRPDARATAPCTATWRRRWASATAWSSCSETLSGSLPASLTGRIRIDHRYRSAAPDHQHHVGEPLTLPRPARRRPARRARAPRAHQVADRRTRAQRVALQLHEAATPVPYRRDRVPGIQRLGQVGDHSRSIGHESTRAADSSWSSSAAAARRRRPPRAGRRRYVADQVDQLDGTVARFPAPGGGGASGSTTPVATTSLACRSSKMASRCFSASSAWPAHRGLLVRMIGTRPNTVPDPESSEDMIEGASGSRSPPRSRPFAGRRSPPRAQPQTVRVDARRPRLPR